MMRKPTGHKERYSIKSEISKIDSDDGTSARTRPFSFDEIMLRRKTKKHSESVKDQRVVYGGGVESDRYRHRDTFEGSEEHASKEQKKVNSRTKEKIVESGYKESHSARTRPVIDNNNAKFSRNERGVHEKRKKQDWSTDNFDHEHQKRHSKSEHSSKRTQNVYVDTGKKHELRKRHDPTTSEKKQKKPTSEFHHEDIKSRSKRSRSRERERDTSKRSKSPAPRGQVQRYHDTHSLKEGRTVLNNGSNERIKRHDASPTRLGGYSPRKRRNEAAVMNSHSSEKKNAGWDSPPVKMETLTKTELSNRHEVASVGPPVTPVVPKATFGILSSIPLTMNVSVDSVQLTQATRPKRRIYVENLPSSASEAAVMQWLSGYLRPFGVNQVQGMSPCISCMVNKEKGQALVEFLTPEDASAALNFDGKSFSGNIVKIRRPKDYVEQSTGVSEKPVAGGPVSINNIVQDSPNKIFVGGISKAITSEMLMEIATAFGPLKAYHFENKAHLHSPCAFVEYADQSVTIKACVGLNGLKLGGQVLTVTQATPDVSLVGDHGDQPFYGTPVHARPLLEKPTQVLKLNNVLGEVRCRGGGGISSKRSEFSRPRNLWLGTFFSAIEAARAYDKAAFELRGSKVNLNFSRDYGFSPEESTKTDTRKDVDPHSLPSHSESELEELVEDIRLECARFGKVKSINVIKQTNEHSSSESKEADPISMVKEVTGLVEENRSHDEPESVNGGNNEMAKEETSGVTMTDPTNPKPTDEAENVSESPDNMKNISLDLVDSFEVGCVLVEYKRIEASSMAAHSLHGRVFDGRNVSVGYVAYDVFCTRFRK